MTETENIQQTENESHNEHRLKVAMAATLVGASALTMAGCSTGNETSNMLADKSHISSVVYGTEKSGDLNHDPHFRATSIEMIRDGFMSGSATLVKSGDTYKLASVEHVARPLLNMKSMIHETGAGIVGDSGETKNPSFNIPGVGVFRLPNTVSFEGKAVTDSNGSVDRYAIFDLPDDEEQAIEKAVEAGTLAVPEKALFQASYGDEFFMPLADTGKNVPFVYLGEQEGEKPMLTPLFLLDENLDYQKGLDSFNDEVRKVAAEFQAQNVTDAEIAARQQVLSEKQAALWQKYNADPAQASEWLPCMGDSGSGILDNQGNVVGTLSSGAPFYDPTGKDSLSTARISRVSESGTANAARFCLSTVQVATG